MNVICEESATTKNDLGIRKTFFEFTENKKLVTLKMLVKLKRLAKFASRIVTCINRRLTRLTNSEV